VYAVNALREIPKTWIATTLLPHIIDSSIGARADKIAHVARILGEDTEGIRTGEAAFRTSAVMRRLIGRLSLPARLRDFGLELDELMELAEEASELEMMNYLPTPSTPEGLFDIIKQAY
jgi:alcohol dehydrogenase class IV